MSISLGELFIELVFEGDTSKAEEFKKKLLEVSKASKEQKSSFSATTKAIAGYFTAITGAIYAVNRLTESLINQNQQFLNLTRSSDIALSTYQKWNAVGQMYGIDNAAAQIKNLNDRLFELKLTGANAQGFMLAGIRPTNAEDVMEQLRNRISGLSDTSAGYLLRQMGLDENMLHILRMSREEFNSLNAEISRFQLTDKQRQSIKELNVQLQIATIKLQYLKDRVILKILPYWIKFINLVASAAEGFKILASKLDPVSKGILSIGAAVIFLWKSLRLLNFNPLILGLTALMAGLMLILDDVRAYMTGGGSVIGVLAKVMEDFQKDGFFSNKVPEWIKLLVRAATIFSKLFGLKVNDMTADEALRGGFTQEEYDALIAKGDAKRAEIANKKVASDISKNEYNNKYSTSNQNNETIIHQNNNIQTTETAQDVLNSLLPFTNAVFAKGTY